MGVDSDPEDLFGSGAESDEDPAPVAAPQTADQHESLDDDVEEPAAGTEKLFGSDSDDEEAKAAPAQAARSTQRQSSDEDEDGDRRTGRRRAAPSGPPMDVEAPLLPVPAANSVHLMRTTNIVGIQPRAFDPATHEKEEEIFEDDNGRARVKLASNAMIRWRLRRLPDGREVPESNARFVRWEDGTMQLLLGHEVLDVAQQDVRANNQYLFCLAGLIQGQCPLNSKLALRPASLDSGLHRRLREAVDKRHVKTNKVASAGGLQNPELEQARREKAEEEKIRSREQLAKKQDRVLSRPYGGGGGYRSKPSRLSDKYLEEDQDWEGDRDAYDYDDGLTADQRARLSMARTRPALDEQAEAEAGRRLQAAKRGGTRSDDRGAPSKRRRAAASDDDEEEEDDDEEDGDYDDDEPEYESSGGDEDEGDEDAAPAPPARGGKIKPAPPPPDFKANKPKRRGVVLSDDDE